jgi:hypothetical protein
MPCSDVTELLKISLDPEDRITSYSLNKRTCGGTMGRDELILKMIRGQTATEIVQKPADEFYSGITFSSDLREMVYLKHYFAVQSGLAEFLGRELSESHSECTVESVVYGPDGVELTVLVHVDMLTDKIKACGGCSGCGSPKKQLPSFRVD